MMMILLFGSFALMKKLMTSFLSSKVTLAKYCLKMKVDLNKVRGSQDYMDCNFATLMGGLAATFSQEPEY